MLKKQKLVVEDLSLVKELSEQEQAAISGGQADLNPGGILFTPSGNKIRTGQNPGNSQSGPLGG